MEILEPYVHFGFPVAVAAFVLLRLERELRRLVEAIEGLRRCEVCRFGRSKSLEVCYGRAKRNES
jgi:hypothetical protein